jgi:hypothetical protein
MLKYFHIYVVEVINSIALLTTMFVSHYLKILDQLPGHNFCLMPPCFAFSIWVVQATKKISPRHRLLSAYVNIKVGGSGRAISRNVEPMKQNYSEILPSPTSASTRTETFPSASSSSVGAAGSRSTIIRACMASSKSFTGRLTLLPTPKWIKSRFRLGSY